MMAGSRILFSLSGMISGVWAAMQVVLSEVRE